MNPELRAQYARKTSDLEEPIREIVPAIWDLPFVLDTEHTCSGHAIANFGSSYGRLPDDSKYKKQFGWYPHGPILNLYYSLDPSLTEARDQFRAGLKAVLAQQGNFSLRFDDVRTFMSDRILNNARFSEPNLTEDYYVSLTKDHEKTDANIELVEHLLVDFWEQVANVVRQLNPAAKIGPIAGKDFRRVINWVKWNVK